MKTLLKYFCFSLFVITLACAPARKAAPPELYEEQELSLEESVKTDQSEYGTENNDP